MMVPNNGDETISVIDVTRVVTTLQGGAGMTVVNYTQGGKMPMSSAGKRAPSVYDMATFKRVNRLKLGANLSLETGATTADGRKIYGASSTDDLVYVIDSTDQVKRIANIGRFSWGVTIWGQPVRNIVIENGYRLDITSDLAFLIFLGILNMDFCANCTPT